MSLPGREDLSYRLDPGVKEQLQILKGGKLLGVVRLRVVKDLQYEVWVDGELQTVCDETKDAIEWLDDTFGGGRSDRDNSGD